MRRLLIDTSAYVSRLFDAIVRGWNAFFFRPGDPTALGLIRVATGVLVFWSMFVYGLDLHDFLGSHGWASLQALKEVQSDPKPYTWSFWTHVPDALLRPVWIGCLLAVAAFTVGLWSRVTAVLTWVIVVSTLRRAPVSTFGFDQITSTLTLYLAVTGASGQAVSFDRFWKRWRTTRALTVRRLKDGRWPVESGVPTPAVSANLALRLIQLHFCLIYAIAGLSKLQGPGWWAGTSLWGTLASAEFNLLDFTWLASHPYVLNFLTHTSLAVEVTYAVLIWPKLTRPLILVSVFLMHVGIGLTAPGLTEFGLAMCAGNLAFVSGPWLRSLVVGLDRSKPLARVLYDGACPRCRASISVVSAADPDRVIEPVDLTAVDVVTIHPSLTPEACLKAMHVVDSQSRVTSGFDAVLALAWRLPTFWIFAAVGSLPGVKQVGRRVYQVVADSRPRDIPCTDDVCGIHPPSIAERAKGKRPQDPSHVQHHQGSGRFRSQTLTATSLRHWPGIAAP